MMAFTSMCEEKWESNSSTLPVRIFTTPPGRSEEFKTSASDTAHKGLFSEARTTQVFPPAITGITVETNPMSEFSCGAMRPGLFFLFLKRILQAYCSHPGRAFL